MTTIWTVETPTGCRCCGDDDVDVRVFASEELANTYASVDGGSVRSHEMEFSLPPLVKWAKVGVTIANGNDITPYESTEETYEVPNCTGTWGRKGSSDTYESDGDAWRGIHVTHAHDGSVVWISVESWTPDTPEARAWVSTTARAVLDDFDGYAARGGRE